jgi:hypothetical protein
MVLDRAAEARMVAAAPDTVVAVPEQVASWERFFSTSYSGDKKRRC